jgi:hypothetical protein
MGVVGTLPGGQVSRFIEGPTLIGAFPAPHPGAIMKCNNQNRYWHPEHRSRSPERSEGEGSLSHRARLFAALRMPNAKRNHLFRHRKARRRQRAWHRAGREASDGNASPIYSYPTTDVQRVGATLHLLRMPTMEEWKKPLGFNRSGVSLVPITPDLTGNLKFIYTRTGKE